MRPLQLTLASVLENACASFTHTEIVSHRSDNTVDQYTYADLYRRALALASALQECGLRHLDRVATLMRNHHVHLEARFGIPIAGGMCHPLDEHLSADELAGIINHAEDRFLIVDDVLVPVFERIKGRVNVERVIVAPYKGGSTCHRYEEYEDLLHDSSGEPDVTDLDETEPGLCCTTGAIGQLETVVFSHRAIALHAYSISQPHNLSIGRFDTILPAMSISDAYSWRLPYAAVMQGSRLVLPGPNHRPEHILDLLATHHVTLAGADPTVWLGVRDALEREPQRWLLVPGTRVIAADFTASEDLVRRLDAFGLQMVQPRGMNGLPPIGPDPTLESLRDIPTLVVNSI
jgi:fatty-acyl-CoA synthase